MNDSKIIVCQKKYPLLVGSEVSGVGLGRADYGPTPNSYNRKNKGVTPIMYESPMQKEKKMIK